MSEPFTQGESMPFYEFERRLRDTYCDGTLPRLAQSTVQIMGVLEDGRLLVTFTAKEKAE
jgi:hypothetical protein